jgi:hypothetical protein
MFTQSTAIRTAQCHTADAYPLGPHYLADDPTARHFFAQQTKIRKIT